MEIKITTTEKITGYCAIVNGMPIYAEVKPGWSEDFFIFTLNAGYLVRIERSFENELEAKKFAPKAIELAAKIMEL